MGLWIPFYAAPGPVYDALIKSVEDNKCLAGSFKAAVLTGPNSGPPPANSTLHREHFTKVAKTNEWTVLGYVDTHWGKRKLEDVLADVDTWLTKGEALGFGDLVQGVWINEAEADFSRPGARDYYSAIIDRIRFFGGLVAFNPGRDVAAEHCDLVAKMDFINAFENSLDFWQAGNYTCTCAAQAPNTRCIASIHTYTGAATPGALSKVMATARARGFQATFITSDPLPNPYATLPPFWPAELSALCATPLD